MAEVEFLVFLAVVEFVIPDVAEIVTGYVAFRETVCCPESYPDVIGSDNLIYSILTSTRHLSLR